MPKWVWPVVGVIIVTLMGTTSGLAVFIFNRLDSRVESLTEKVDALNQKFWALDAKIDVTLDNQRKQEK